MNPKDLLPGTFLMVDGSTSPKTSPISSAGSDEIFLTVPAQTEASWCIRLSVYAPSAAITLRKVSGGASGGTATVPAATWFSVPCKPGDVIYFARGTATTVEFCFESVQP